MREFVKKVCTFIIVPIIILGILYWIHFQNIPAPKYSTSYCFNEKLYYIENYHCEYLTIGSSMALNNLNSDVLIDNYIKNKNYLNLASWGMKISDDYVFMKEYIKKYKPRKVFLASNVMDFDSSRIQLRTEDFSFRIKYPFFFTNVLFYFKKIDVDYYSKYFKENRINKYNNNVYTSINFDEYGAVIFMNDDFKIINDRWNRKIEFDKIWPQNYNYLDSLCLELKKEEVDFVFIQNPLREGLIDSNYIENIMTHKRKIIEIIEKYNYQFIDGTNKFWADSLFVDFSHFNEIGTMQFTKYICNKLHSKVLK